MEDPRIEFLAQSALKTAKAADISYYRVAAKEFLALDDAYAEYMAQSGPQPPPEPALPRDVREERKRIVGIIRDSQSVAIRLARKFTANTQLAGAMMAIAMELQNIIDQAEA